MATTLLYKTASDQPNFATEAAVAGYEPARPYPQNPQVIVYRTRFMQLRAFYTRPAALTPHPDLPQVYFADDVDFQDKTSGLVEWTRVYTTLPSSWNDFGSEAYSYPGYQGTLSVLGRNPFSHIVTTKITRDYFAVGNFASFQNNLANYDSFASSPWSKYELNNAANSANIPACAGGNTVATLLTTTAANDFHYVFQTANITSGVLWGAVFLKPYGTTQNVQIQIRQSAGNSGFINVNLATGQVFSNAGCLTVDVAPIGDGWWRIKGAINTNGSATGDLMVLAANATYATQFVGDGSGFYAWRGQLAVSNTSPYSTVPPTVAGDGTTNYPITAADQIPVKFGTRYLYQVPWGVGGSNAVASQFVAEFLSDGGYGLVATSPTLSNYKNYVTTDSGNTNSYSIESQDSVQTLWYGAIWERQRRYVKAI